MCEMLAFSLNSCDFKEGMRAASGHLNIVSIDVMRHEVWVDCLGKEAVNRQNLNNCGAGR